MKRFRFPLRPVAVLRAHRETRARESFAAAVRGYVQSEAVLSAARDQVARLGAALTAGRRTSFNAAEEAHTLAAYRRECAAEIEAERAVIAARDLMGRRRAEYLEAHRNLEVVSKLELKARTAHRLAAGREEQSEFDEFAARLFTRQPPLFSS